MHFSEEQTIKFLYPSIKRESFFTSKTINVTFDLWMWSKSYDH